MLIYMQKINFITYFFIKILQINSKPVILGNLGMAGHTHLKWYYQLEEIFDVYLQAKNQLYSSRFPWDIPMILQTCYFGYFGQAWLHTPKMIVSSLFFICRRKSHFIPHVFLAIMQRYAIFLFWVLWACPDTHTQDGKINLWKISMFLYMEKINIIHVFLEILHLKESCSSTGQQNFGP